MLLVCNLLNSVPKHADLVAFLAEATYCRVATLACPSCAPTAGMTVLTTALFVLPARSKVLLTAIPLNRPLRLVTPATVTGSTASLPLNAMDTPLPSKWNPLIPRIS